MMIAFRRVGALAKRTASVWCATLAISIGLRRFLFLLVLINVLVAPFRLDLLGHKGWLLTLVTTTKMIIRPTVVANILLVRSRFASWGVLR